MSAERLPQVAVLLAACNGERWIAMQVASILDQQGVDVRLCISVDAASQDGTLDWCQALAARDARVSLLPAGQRFGRAATNFFRLLREADLTSCDFVALADQDDVWLVDHLQASCQRIQRDDLAACSANVLAFWPDGRRVTLRKAQPQRRYDFLFEAAGPGCSYVLRMADALALRQFLLDERERVDQVWLHDWMIYGWFRATGRRWHIEAQPRILYRQHASNHVGVNMGWKAALSRLRLLRRGWYRGEIARISSLLQPWLPELPAALAEGRVPAAFLLQQGSQLRRRGRDRWLLAAMLLSGFY